jgi:hypothetical protein
MDQLATPGADLLLRSWFDRTAILDQKNVLSIYPTKI